MRATPSACPAHSHASSARVSPAWRRSSSSGIPAGPPSRPGGSQEGLLARVLLQAAPAAAAAGRAVGGDTTWPSSPANPCAPRNSAPPTTRPAPMPISPDTWRKSARAGAEPELAEGGEVGLVVHSRGNQFSNSPTRTSCQPRFGALWTQSSVHRAGHREGGSGDGEPLPAASSTALWTSSRRSGQQLPQARPSGCPQPVYDRSRTERVRSTTHADR